ncbi:hypothetical protein B0H65DRAFT_471583 [Neurospora tetraspora]|uniref:Uncharacterized protein n=1 Tax=Neurospora tetraspora TaxID=94610 RepID=A0AAE0J9Y9_9PEZI|nr:hypothetical protein B0H65DRAFT_471583 [Neurospora tetraspora]
MAYFKLQVGQLHALVSICGQIRDEVLSEYFHRTQVYLWYHVNLHVPCAMQHIMSSLLFASYTQHVSLRWDIDSFYVMPSTLDWLLQLKQLKTLELLITRSYLPPIISKYHEENLFPQSMKLALDDYFGSIHFQRLTTLRNLEKIVVKLCFGPHRWCPSPEVHAGIWERTPRFQKIKETLSESVREDLRQVCCTLPMGVPLPFSPASLKTNADSQSRALMSFSQSNSRPTYLSSTSVPSIPSGLGLIGFDAILRCFISLSFFFADEG